MILITGGLGFIGTHITRALLELGESCVLAQRSTADVPATFADEANRRVFVEQVDITHRAAFLQIANRHPITGIINLVGAFGMSELDPVDDVRMNLDSLVNVLQAARDWQVPRIGTASTIGVYLGALHDGPLSEDTPLPMTTGHGIPAFKKTGELLTDYIAGTTDIEIINYRISAAWGPLGHPTSPFFAAPALVHAAARGTVPDLSALRAPAYADDGLDLVYVTDCARAIALLHLADKLHHRTYNIAAGRPTTNREIIAAIRAIVPDFHIDLPDGRDPTGPGHDIYLDISRLHQDTGHRPTYDTERAVAEYLTWLRAGSPR